MKKEEKQTGRKDPSRKRLKVNKRERERERERERARVRKMKKANRYNVPKFYL